METIESDALATFAFSLDLLIGRFYGLIMAVLERKIAVEYVKLRGSVLIIRPYLRYCTVQGLSMSSTSHHGLLNPSPGRFRAPVQRKP